MPYNKKLVPLAKSLRKGMTSQERHLWYDFLSHYPIRFQRQKVIDNYIADFYCASAKLVVEIDGSQHYTDEQAVYDSERTLKFISYGIEVIRFSNWDIDTNFRAVCEEIDKVVKQSSPIKASLTEGGVGEADGGRTHRREP